MAARAPMEPLSITPMQAHDADAVHAMIRAAFDLYIAPDYSATGAATFLAYVSPAALRARLADHVTLVARASDGEIVGVCQLRARSHLSMLFVAPHLHRHGLGRRLLDEALRACAPTGAITVNSSPYAVPIYERLGFVATGAVADSGGGVRSVPMRLDLGRRERMDVMHTLRRSRHRRVSASLAARTDGDLAALLRDATPNAAGVGGGSSVLDVDGVPVFAKRIPITDRELAHPHSTANLFDLPTYCQYGMYPLAGPGFSAWRELAANLIVTDGVLAGDTQCFPLLHHWRVLPGRPPIASEHLDLDAVVAQFGGDAAVRIRFDELAAATSSLVLFLEHVPRPLLDTLTDPLGQAETLERQLFEIVAFLRSRDLLHMDGHFGNLRADDERIYLVDFGLATSPRFELSNAERDFVARHIDHDADYAAMRLVNWLVTTVCRVPMPSSGGPVERNAYVRRCASGDIPHDVPTAVANILARHAPAASRMNDFCWRLFDGDLHAEYPGA